MNVHSIDFRAPTATEEKLKPEVKEEDIEPDSEEDDKIAGNKSSKISQTSLFCCALMVGALLTLFEL